MARCRYCGQSLWTDRERMGARCPRCREPVYERPVVPEQTAEDAGATGACATHPRNVATGTCQRCGNYVCPVCRTGWQDRALCVACVERVLDAGEAAPEEARAHLRQAILAVALGIFGWALTLGGLLLFLAGLHNELNGTHEESNAVLAGFGMLLLLASPLPAVLGVGQGAAAIRARGNHMILATIGLFLSGLQAGVVVGMITVSLMQAS